MSEYVELYGEDEDVAVTVNSEVGPIFVEWHLSGSRAEREAKLGDMLQAMGLAATPSGSIGDAAP